MRTWGQCNCCRKHRADQRCNLRENEVLSDDLISLVGQTEPRSFSDSSYWLEWSHHGEKMPVRMSLDKELRWLDHLQMMRHQVYSCFSELTSQSYQSSRSRSAYYGFLIKHKCNLFKLNCLKDESVCIILIVCEDQKYNQLDPKLKIRDKQQEKWLTPVMSLECNWGERGSFAAWSSFIIVSISWDYEMSC